METIKIECVSGNTYEGFKLTHQRELPKNATLSNCGQEINNGTIGKPFNVYRSYLKRGNKTYIIFTKEF